MNLTFFPMIIRYIFGEFRCYTYFYHTFIYDCDLLRKLKWFIRWNYTCIHIGRGKREEWSSRAVSRVAVAARLDKLRHQSAGTDRTGLGLKIDERPRKAGPGTRARCNRETTLFWGRTPRVTENRDHGGSWRPCGAVRSRRKPTRVTAIPYLVPNRNASTAHSVPLAFFVFAYTTKSPLRPTSAAGQNRHWY